MSKNIGKNISENLSVKYKQNRIDHAKQSATEVFQTGSKRAIQKTAETTGDFIGNKTPDKITKVWKTSPQKNCITVTNEEENIGVEREINKEKYISSEKKRNLLMI